MVPVSMDEVDGDDAKVAAIDDIAKVHRACINGECSSCGDGSIPCDVT